ncbi:hypothetical protein BZA77DRAFT_368666 [Pyronema omphalodes]|nr:hypothetical protein BZA77DRAFT_368666 [Pyronema omphalodes]
MPPPSTSVSTQPTKLPSKKPQLTPRLISSSNRAAQPSSASPLLSPHPNHTAIPFTNLGGPSPPPSAPASYSSGGGSVPRQLKGYTGFEEHSYGSPHGNSYPQYAGSPNSAAGGLTVAAGHHLARHASSNGHTGQVYEFATVDDAKGIEENVVTVAFEGGVEIWKVGRSAVDMVGRLEGMRGVVRGVKILPNPPVHDPLASSRPLVALTIHAPIEQQSDTEEIDAQSPYSSSPSPSQRSSHGRKQYTEWQTSVEVWSLSTGHQMATLFSIPDAVSQGSTPLRVQVTGDRIVVGLASGELYIFGIDCTAPPLGAQNSEWKCLDKLWTSVHYPIIDNSSIPVVAVGTPIFTLSPRFLAYCPASSGFSAGGEVGVTIASATVSAPVPPPMPQVSVAMNLDDEAFLNKLTREVAQEMIRGAKWAKEAGYKKFSNYWNGAGAPGAAGLTGSSPPLGGMAGFAPQPYSHSPPGQPSGLGQQLRQLQLGVPVPPPVIPHNEPRFVSIVDLQKPGMTPLATFLPPGGVSFLSFAPGGLTLLTASTKGDMLLIWCLLRMVHNPPGPVSVSRSEGPAATAPAGTSGLSAAATGPAEQQGRVVRQIARFTRMTVANIVDITWSSPPEKVAVVTDRGTAHFYDLPASSLQWPPPRRVLPTKAAVNQGGVQGVAAAAVGMVTGKTQPLLTAARRRSSVGSYASAGLGSLGSIPGLGGLGSLPGMGTLGSLAGKTASAEGGDRITIPGTSFNEGCVKFLISKERGHVAVLGGGVMRIYELRLRGSKGKSAGVKTEGWCEYDLPCPGPSSQEPLSWWGTGGHRTSWRDDDMTSIGGLSPRIGSDNMRNPLSNAEIETNAAFIPWHQEGRVKMFLYHAPPPTPPTTPPKLAAKNRRDHKEESSARAPAVTPMSMPLSEPMRSHADILSPSPIAGWEPTRPGSRENKPAQSVVQETEDTGEQPTGKKGKKGKKSKQPISSASSSGSSNAGVPLPPPTPAASASPASPPVLPAEISALPIQDAEVLTGLDEIITTPIVEVKKEDPWVFGLDIQMERIFLRDAGGRGDVIWGEDEVAEEGIGGLMDAMDEEEIVGLRTTLRERREGPGFFEEGVEVLDFEGGV